MPATHLRLATSRDSCVPSPFAGAERQWASLLLTGAGGGAVYTVFALPHATCPLWEQLWADCCPITDPSLIGTRSRCPHPEPAYSADVYSAWVELGRRRKTWTQKLTICGGQRRGERSELNAPFASAGLGRTGSGFLLSPASAFCAPLTRGSPRECS